MTEGPNSPPSKDLKREYADERDMDRFWEVAQLEREPARQWWYIPLIVVLVLIGIPWGGMRIGEFSLEFGPVAIGAVAETNAFFDYEAIILGLPVWIWITGACTLGLSILTSFAILRFWRDNDSDSD